MENSIPGDQPLVSIIMPAYNVAGVIEQTLDSIRHQTYPHYEVIIAADEGSTDDTLAVSQRWCGTDPRFAVIRHPHSNLPAARNTAIEQARGELVAFLDADDVWLPEKLSRQVEIFAQNPEVNFSFANYFAWNGQKDLGIRYQAKQPLPEGAPLNRLIFGNLYCISTVMVRRQLLDRAGRFDPQMTMVEDWDLWVRMAECGMLAKGIPDPLARYRRWTGSVSNNKLRNAQYTVLVLKKNLEATQHPEFVPRYQRALAKFRQHEKLFQARQWLDGSPQKISEAIWRAWRQNPREVKWLFHWLLFVWPRALGGKSTSAYVERKLREKF